MHVTTPSRGKITITAWAHTSSFYGNFDLTGPGGLYNHGGTKTFYSGSSPTIYTFANLPAVVGKYCVLGWSGGALIGKPCETVG
jgi:hypothetical protein